MLRDDGELPVGDVDHDGRVLGQVTAQERAGHAGLHLAGDEPPQGTSAVRRVEALLRHEPPGLLRGLERDPLLRQPLPQLVELEIDDALDLGERQRLEQHDLVDPVQELRPEVGPQGAHHQGAGLRLHLAVRRDPLEQVLRPDVGGHDDDGVAEVDRATVGVGEAPVVEHLEQDVEDVDVGLLDLVEQDHRVVLAPNRLGQLAAFLESDVSGWGPHEPAHGVPLLVLAHVDADDVLLAVEEGFRERLGELGLAHAGRAEEDEGADRAGRVLDAGARPHDRVGHQLHRLVLADHPLVEHLVEAEDLLPLALLEAVHRDARPPGHDGGDLVGGDDLTEQAPPGLLGLEPFLGRLEPSFEFGQLAVAQARGPVQVVLPLGPFALQANLLDLLPQRLYLAERLALRLPLGPHGVGLGLEVGQLLAQLLEATLAGRIRLLGQCGLLDLQAGDPAGELVELRGHRVDLGAQHRAGLVDQVDGLVGQEPVGDVAVAQGDRGDQGAVVDLDAVEDLEALAQSPEDRQGVLDARLVDHDRLEPALEGRVLLDVGAVLVERRGPDHVQLAAGQHGLQHLAGVHRTFGRAGPDHGVQLVDEQQDLPLGGQHLVEDGLESFLELAAVLRTGDEGAHVQGEDGLVAQSLGHVPVVDPLRQALHDGGLPDPGLTDQHRVVLALAGQDLDGATDLRVPADHRLQPSGGRVRDEVATVLGEGLVGSLGRGGRDPLGTPHRGQGLQERVARHAMSRQDPTGCRAGSLVEERDHQVLDGDVLVLEPAGLLLGGLEDAVQPLGDVHLPGLGAGPGDARALLELGLQVFTQPVHIRTRPGQQRRNQPFALLQQRQQQVFTVHLLVTEPERLGLGVVQCFLRLLRESVQVHRTPLSESERRCDLSRSEIRSSRSITRPSDE